jgi:hypothetical protein
MRLGEISREASRQSEPAPRGSSEPAPAEPSASSRALVALTPPAPFRQAPEAYRQAPFLTHLLAVKDQHPQTRERRRAESNDVLAAYRATVALTHFR